MRILGIVLGLCLVSTLAFAGAEGEIVSIDRDVNGNIRVWTQYKVDGLEVQSSYPKIGGKFVYCTRYNAAVLIDFSDAEIKAKMLADVDAHTKTLIKNKYSKEANSVIVAGHLGTIIGSKVSNQSTTEVIGETEYTFKSDGTHTSKPAIVQ